MTPALLTATYPTTTATSGTTPAVQWAAMPTPLGPLTILAADGIVRAGGFTDDLGALVSRLGPTLVGARIEHVRMLGQITDALDAYFAGEIGALDSIPVEQPGGPFQQRVWAALRALPAGEPATYRDLALRLGGPGHARAVGMGCATNAVSPIVPCHRVTRSDGKLAGYYWRLDRKRWLLDHERQYRRAP